MIRALNNTESCHLKQNATEYCEYCNRVLNCNNIFVRLLFKSENHLLDVLPLSTRFMNEFTFIMDLDGAHEFAA